MLAMGSTLQVAQCNAVQGLLDATEDTCIQLAVPRDAVDFAYLVQYTRDCGNEVIAMQVRNGVPQAYNR